MRFNVLQSFLALTANSLKRVLFLSWISLRRMLDKLKPQSSETPAMFSLWNMKLLLEAFPEWLVENQCTMELVCHPALADSHKMDLADVPTLRRVWTRVHIFLKTHRCHPILQTHWKKKDLSLILMQLGLHVMQLPCDSIVSFPHVVVFKLALKSVSQTYSGGF